MRAFGLAVLVALVGCGGDSSGVSTAPSSNSSGRTLRVVAGQTTDTIGAHLAGAIQVSVMDGMSRPVALASVRFSVVPNNQLPTPGIVLSPAGDTTLTIRTASSGTATLDVDLGKYTGTFGVVVTTEGIAWPDTTTFTVLPGAVVSLRIPTHDTLVSIGAAYKPLIFAADRAGNPPVNPPTLTSARPVCQVSGVTVAASNIARCVVTIRAGAIVDSITINAIPKLPVTAIVYNAGSPWIATMNLDGTSVKLIRATSRDIFDPLHPVLGPSGLLAAIDVGGDGKTHVETIDATGTARFIPVDLPVGAEENWPVFSRDGQWIYFSACNWPIFEHCRVWQTRPDGSQAKILTPSTGSSGQRTNWAVLSFDGRMLAYAGYGEQLHTLNLQTGADVDLGVSAQAFDMDSTARRLLYVKDSFGASPLLITNIDGTNPIALAGGRSFSGYAQWLPGEQWVLSRGVISDSHSSGGDNVLVNVTTGELVPVRYSLPVGELYIIR